MKDRAQVEKDRQAREIAIQRVLKTEDGKKLMEELELVYDGSLVGHTDGGVDPHATFINVGAREVVIHLKRVRDRENT